jgi:putative endonuclease
MVPRATASESRGSWYVYILRCADSSLYVGFAQNVDERVKIHNLGQGAAFTFKRRPLRLVYSENLGSLAQAVHREQQIKRWTRAKKEALIANELQKLKHLSKRRKP